MLLLGLGLFEKNTNKHNTKCYYAQMYCSQLLKGQHNLLFILKIQDDMLKIQEKYWISKMI